MNAVERIVVALDAVSENLPAIGVAARLAARWKTRLHGVFVEDDDLIRLAHLPFARQVTLGTGVEHLSLQQTEQELRAFAERARHDLETAAQRHGIEWSFEILRGGATSEPVGAARGDFLVAGTTTRPVGGYFRVECRWWSVVAPGSGPVLLAHRDWHPRGTFVVLLHDLGPVSERLLATAARFAEAHDGRFAVLCAPGLGRTPEVGAWLDAQLAGHPVKVELDVAPSESAALIRRLGELDCGVVALAADAEEARSSRLRELVAKLACDVLVVR